MKFMGCSVNSVTFPVGKDVSPLRMAMPMYEPAATTWYSGASSQKYLKAVRPRAASWTSSKKSNVVAGSMLVLRTISISETIRAGSRSLANSPWRAGSRMKSIRTVDLNARLPNSSKSHVLPVCRAPLKTSGLRWASSFHARSRSMSFRSIAHNPSHLIAVIAGANAELLVQTHSTTYIIPMSGDRHTILLAIMWERTTLLV